MGWLRFVWVPGLVAAVFVALVVIAIAEASRKDRAKLNAGLVLRTDASGGLIDHYLTAQGSLMVARAEAALSDRTITSADLRLALSGLAYQAGGVLDGRGRLLINQPYSPALIGRNFSRSRENIRIVLQKNRAAVSPEAVVTLVLKAPAVGIAVPYRTSYGRRIFSGVLALQGQALSSLTREAVGPERSTLYLLDRAGNLIATTTALSATITPLSKARPVLARALARHSTGSYSLAGRGYHYASTPVAGTGGWRLVSTVSDASLYASTSSERSTGRWLIIASGLLAIAAASLFVVLARRRQLTEGALRESEQRLRVAVTSLPLTVFTQDRDLRYTWIVEPAPRRSPQAVVGRTDADMVPTDDAARLTEIKRGVLERGVGTRVEVSAASDGDERWLDLTVEPLRDRRGGIIGIIGAFSDITERRAVAEALRGSEARLRQVNVELERRVAERTAGLQASNRELEAFAYSVAHDLRAPLRAIAGFSQILLEESADRLDEQDRHRLDRVRAAAQRMGTLIDELLELSRLVRVELRREPIDLSALARNIVQDLRERDPERSVELVVADGLTADGDPLLVRALLENLLDNAWKFTAPRERARIELGQIEQNGKRVFFVGDDGVGFDMAYAARLFKPFQRLHGAEFSGTGVGLTTVLRIVERHGGRVWVEAQVEKGATFYFTLPASK